MGNKNVSHGAFELKMFHVKRNYIFPIMKFHRRIKYSLIISRLRIMYLSIKEPDGAIFDKDRWGVFKDSYY